MIKQIRIIILLLLLGSILNISMMSAIIIGSTSNNNTLASPIDMEVYYSLKVKFNLSSDNNLGEVRYANLMDTGLRCAEGERFENTCWKILCANCNGYGNDRDRKLTMNEGMNKIVVRVIDKDSNTSYFNVTIFVDSTKPKIISTHPRRNKVVNGSDFTIVYSEFNLNNIILVYGKDNNFTNITKNCSSGKAQVCRFSVNLTEYENQSIYYYFILNNLIYSVNSQITKIVVDTISPILTIYAPEEVKHYYKKVPFNITINKKSKIEYMDKSDNNPVWRNICYNCDKFGNEREQTKSMPQGVHDISIRATDKAGNSDIKNISFVIDFI